MSDAEACMPPVGRLEKMAQRQMAYEEADLRRRIKRAADELLDIEDMRLLAGLADRLLETS